MIRIRFFSFFGLLLCSVVLCCVSFRLTRADLLPAWKSKTSIQAKVNVEVAAEALNGMILVERLADPEFTESGLFRSRNKETIRRFLARVAAIPPEGFTNENGFHNPVETMCPYKVGDLVYVDNHNAPTSEFKGPGPKPKLYSYHRPWYIKAVVRSE